MRNTFLVEIQRNLIGKRNLQSQSKALAISKVLIRRVKTFRLNDQHRLLTKVTENTLIHPSIPKENLLSVADIATGTG